MSRRLHAMRGTNPQTAPYSHLSRPCTPWRHQRASSRTAQLFTRAATHTPATDPSSVSSLRRSTEDRGDSTPSQVLLGSAEVLEAKKHYQMGQQQQWEKRLQQVLAFQAAYGRIPRQTAGESSPFIPGEKELGVWCGYQRRRRDGTVGTPLSAQQDKALSAVPGWQWGRQRYTRQPWEAWYTQVVEFVMREGRIPRMTAGRHAPLLAGERVLAVWCDGQRQRWKGQGRQGPLSPNQVAALEAVPGWYWQQFRTEPWEERYTQVVEYVQLHGRFPRLSGSGVSRREARLGHWCKAQRQRYKLHRGHAPMTPTQEAALEAIPGWYWEKHSCTRQPWGEWYAQVVGFVAVHGQLPRVVSGEQEVGSREGEKQLAVWCHRQRQRWKRQGKFSLLTSKEVAALEAIPGWHWGQQRGGGGEGSTGVE